MKTKLNILVILALLLTLMGGTVTPAQAAVGDLDLTFGTDGIAVTHTAGMASESYFNQAVFVQQSDGKIIVGGFSSATGGYPVAMLERYNADGSLDENFGESGVIYPALPDAMSHVSNVFAGSEGEVIAVGGVSLENAPSQVYLARYDSDGQPVDNFGTDGVLRIELPEQVYSMFPMGSALQGADGILVAGECEMTNPDNPTSTIQGAFLMRMTLDGAIDPSFGENGLVLIPYEYGLAQILLPSDGKILVSSYPEGYSPIIFRFTSDGEIDVTFGTDGTGYAMPFSDILSYNDVPCEELAEGPDGKFYLTRTLSDDFFLGRFNADGSPDTGYGEGGYVTLDFAGDIDYACSLLVQTDGKVIVGGGTLLQGYVPGFALARFNADGELDTSFGSDGKIITPSVTVGLFAIFQLDMTPDGKLLAGGIGAASPAAPYTTALVRYDLGESTDTTPPTLNPIVSPNPVLLNGSATASPNATDNESGVATASCDPVVTSSVGTYTITCTATDNAGNTATADVTYTVNYNFIGFSQPVDNNGVLNIAKAGQTIPLKFRITDANGNPVTNLTSVTVTAVSLSCTIGTTIDQIEEYATGSSGLQNLGDGYYQWNWKTSTAYANSCKTLRLDLGDGLLHIALFQFKK